MQKKGQQVLIETYNSNKVDQHGGEADLILLTPTFDMPKMISKKKFLQHQSGSFQNKITGCLMLKKLYKEIESVLEL